MESTQEPGELKYLVKGILAEVWGPPNLEFRNKIKYLHKNLLVEPL